MRSYWDFGNLDFKRFGRRLWVQFWEDRVMGVSAELSFYLVLSIFPFLLFVTSLLGMILKSGAILEETLDNQLRAVAPESVVTLLQNVLQEVSMGSGGGKLAFGLLFAIWAASHGMSAVMQALNIAYEVRESRRWWKRRLISFMLTGGFLLLTLLALVLLLYGPRLVEYLASQLGLATMAVPFAGLARILLLLGFVLTAFNYLYVLAPNLTHRRWHWLMPGTVAAVVIWLLASYGFKLYLGFFNRYSATYGSIGAVIILLLWFYITGMAILIGGEINSELEKSFGDVEENEEG